MSERLKAGQVWVRGDESLRRRRRVRMRLGSQSAVLMNKFAPAVRPWCWEPVPGYQGGDGMGHTCHLRTGHGGRHCANLCGLGRKGGRTAKWTSADDLVITGPKGEECDRCADNRKASEHPRVRVVGIPGQTTR